ncbi:putative odorant receptor 85d [Osmia bicornis bicornis]|uniref:putative odorant receptor 85d n=1 Tax=Osmia bicornis bicornis TaxID=1437191 RepID=UPI0010F49970|nr:putative odorant receptor 85d [Osmia bicornis bicornis]
MIMCRSQQKQFQVLYFDMEEFCKRATPSERIVLQRYVDRYKYFHGVYTLWCFLTTVFVISGPLYSPQTFPTHAIYPFSVERQPLKCFIFFHQSLVGFQVSSGMATDTQVALLLRYTAARFELLAMQLHAAKSGRELNACIKEHSELLRYTRKVCESVRFLVLATVATTTIAVIFGSLNLVTDQPLPLKILYAIIVFSASVELFMYAWPADNLMRMSARIAIDAYNTNWFESDLAMQRKIYFIIRRSQKLEIIRINGIVPRLSLLYYAKYLYKSTSYFAALRIIVEK